ncbi:MAG: protein jag [Candidatus Rokubacteria bacterium]|nr:protein jag [Candidatus Rokubacteria bacterium]
MIAIEEVGRSIEEAVEAGLKRLGLPRELVVVETLEEANRGFLGLVGGRQARVRLVPTQMGEQVLHAKEVLAGLLQAMGVETEIGWEELPEGGLRLNLSGPHAGLLIGKHGQTLEALQFIVHRIVSRQPGERLRIQLDVEGYVERRRQQLEQYALRLAQQVKSTGEPVTLDPMNPADRRTVHLVLQRDSEVRTESLGEGLLRRLVIAPAGRRL